MKRCVEVFQFQICVEARSFKSCPHLTVHPKLLALLPPPHLSHEQRHCTPCYHSFSTVLYGACPSRTRELLLMFMTRSDQRATDCAFSPQQQYLLCSSHEQRITSNLSCSLNRKTRPTYQCRVFQSYPPMILGVSRLQQRHLRNCHCICACAVYVLASCRSRTLSTSRCLYDCATAK